MGREGKIDDIKSQTESQSEAEKILPKPITLEVLRQNKDFLKIVCDKIDEENKWLKSKSPDRSESFSCLVDLGKDYVQTDIHKIMFYIACQLGFVAAYSDSVIEEYLKKMLVENEQEAELYINGKNEIDKKVSEWIKRGSDLSAIIPGAPEMVQEEMWQIMKESETPEIMYRDTPKVHDIPLDLNVEEKRKLQSIFENKTVLDLGAGSTGEGLRISHEFGAKNYIGVEPAFAKDLLFYSSRIKTRGEAAGIESIHIAETDMLSFLKRLPEKVGDLVILMSGIDEWIIGTSGIHSEDEKARGRKYIRTVFSEIKRVMGKDCNLISYESFRPSEKEGFKKIAEFGTFVSPISVFGIEN